MTNIVDKIKGLLRKADRTDNDAEREAFQAKAFELMAREGIDRIDFEETDARAANTATIEVRTSGYVSAWDSLVMAIATPNACEVVKSSADRHRADGGWGWEKWTRYNITGVGHTPDMVAVLFTSLQAQALAHTKSIKGWDARSTKADRLGFLRGFAATIQQRLQEQVQRIDAETDGRLVPALRSDSAIARDKMDELFPHRRTSRRSQARSSARGREAGSAAGARADLGGSRVGSGARKALA